MKQIVLFLKKWISIIINLSANLQRHFKVGTFRRPIKLVQVAFISELHENQRNDLLFFEIVPCHFCGASEVQT